MLEKASQEVPFELFLKDTEKLRSKQESEKNAFQAREMGKGRLSGGQELSISGNPVLEV